MSVTLLSPVEILKQLTVEQRSGCLQAFSNGVYWHLYLLQGQLQLATCSVQSTDSIDFHLRRLGLREKVEFKRLAAFEAFFVNRDKSHLVDLEFFEQMIERLVLTGLLSFAELKVLWKGLTEEAIESFLWLTEGEQRWIEAGQSELLKLPDFFSKFSLDQDTDIISALVNKMLAWQTLSPVIRSPYQRPYFFAQSEIDEVGNPGLMQISKALKGLSFRQLSLVLKQDEFIIAKFLYSHIQEGRIYLRNPQAAYQNLPLVPTITSIPSEIAVPPKPLTISPLKIACIDDSPTILNEMNRLLDSERYSVTKIDDPVKASSLLFRLRPDLILMDVTMPEINGYQLCSLLRSSVALRETPIVMVTGRKGLIDKVKGRLAGANEYLTKPFKKAELLSLVNKYAVANSDIG
ncbi:MAG: response regulator [Cyanobacteria bacterium P01_H01_bin.15]